MHPTEGLLRNLVKIGQAISEKKKFKDNDILYMYIAQGQGLITPGDKILKLKQEKKKKKKKKRNKRK